MISKFAPHISAEGVQCEAACDRYGYHLQQCPSGGGYFVGHDTVCAKFGDLAGGSVKCSFVENESDSRRLSGLRSSKFYLEAFRSTTLKVRKMSFFFACTQGKSSGLHSNTKARCAAVQ